jgi:hypothetical protein
LNRPAIPAELKRRILVEAGHRCAIPTCRSTQVEIAHILPWSKVRVHEYENLIALCPNCHTRVHNKEIDTKSLRHYKAQLRYVLEKYSRYEMDVLEMLHDKQDNQAMPIHSHMILLVKLAIDDGLLRWEETKVGVRIGGLKSNPDFLFITDKGRRFMDDFHGNRGATYESVGELQPMHNP